MKLGWVLENKSKSASSFFFSHRLDLTDCQSDTFFLIYLRFPILLTLQIFRLWSNFWTEGCKEIKYHYGSKNPMLYQDFGNSMFDLVKCLRRRRKHLIRLAQVWGFFSIRGGSFVCLFLTYVHILTISRILNRFSIFLSCNPVFQYFKSAYLSYLVLSQLIEVDCSIWPQMMA